MKSTAIEILEPRLDDRRLAACAPAATAAPRAEVIEQVLIKVNGEIVTKTDLEARQVAALRQLGQQADLKTNPSDAQLRKMLDDVTPKLMVNVIDEILIVQRGKELGYTMSDEQFKNIVDNIKKENKLETEEQFQQALKQENMTMEDLRKNFERQWIVSRVQQNEVVGKIGVSDEEARATTTAHLSEFTTPQSITLREILVAVPGDGTTRERRAGRGRQRKTRWISAGARSRAARASRSLPLTCRTPRLAPTPA